MITCPWCGTSYQTFQPNCSNCGGPLPAVEVGSGSTVQAEDVPIPPQAPRSISNRYIWRLLLTDGLAIVAFIFGLLGLIFSVVGAVLTIIIVTAFVGIPFLLIGIAFLGFGGSVGAWRYQKAQKVVEVLRVGDAAHGQIVEVHENEAVTVNGQHPWVIQYQFQVIGQAWEGKITTLKQPGPALQPGNAVCVLYLPTTPQWNSIYPHP